MTEKQLTTDEMITECRRIMRQYRERKAAEQKLKDNGATESHSSR